MNFKDKKKAEKVIATVLLEYKNDTMLGTIALETLLELVEIVHDRANRSCE